MLAKRTYSTETENKVDLSLISDYEDILRSFHLEYKLADYYWQVGKIEKTQGWILHLSVVLSQVKKLVNIIIPFLLEEGVPFKIVMSASICEDLLNGNLGVAQIGKVVSIYPENDPLALTLSKKLIALTMSFKGPAIPTDICLGSILYARYGSFDPIIKLDANRNEEKYIYDGAGQLIKDSYSMPFQLPNGIHWPFGELTAPILPEPPKQLNRLYKPVDVLKIDPRGNVFKGLYVKNLLQVKHCVIKQAFSNMSSDEAGRDIQDRLVWQHELYKELRDTIPMPIIYALFREQGSTVLIMEFIKGSSLFDQLIEINPLSKPWQDLPLNDSVQLLKYFIEITQIIERMHKKGYVHRDIVPVNFLINKKDKIVLIDIELAYLLKDNTPDPPFKLGTPGFISPEQKAIQKPTVQEDIYGLGASLLYLFTGIYPVKFNTQDKKGLMESLSFFIGSKEMAMLIANSLHPEAKFRPAIGAIAGTLTKYQRELHNKVNSPTLNQSYQDLAHDKLKEIISQALKGLNNEPVVVMNDLWYSKQITIENFTAPKNKQYAINPGTAEGLSGVLYVLARVHKTGLSIDSCTRGYAKAWQLLEKNYFSYLPELSPGLYKGAAGLALSLAVGIRSGLLENNNSNRNKIQACFNNTVEDINLANGIAGQGLSLLLCKDYLKDDTTTHLLYKIKGDLLDKRQKGGSWIQVSESNKIYNIGYDNTGIIYFLLAYLTHYSDIDVHYVTVRELGKIITNREYMKRFSKLIASKDSYIFGDGGKGLILTLIKAFEVLKEEKYKQIAETALLKYPFRVVHSNFNQESGLAALGELYLHAWQVFKNEEWRRRADWIANVFIRSFFRKEDGSGYWVMDQNNPPTADFFSGNTGILHFLIRCLYPDTIKYRLLE
jgi:serine/threonine protein kinase